VLTRPTVTLAFFLSFKLSQGCQVSFERQRFLVSCEYVNRLSNAPPGGDWISGHRAWTLLEAEKNLDAGNASDEDWKEPYPQKPPDGANSMESSINGAGDA
jgi:hypothetical protein